MPLVHPLLAGALPGLLPRPRPAALVLAAGFVAVTAAVVAGGPVVDLDHALVRGLGPYDRGVVHAVVTAATPVDWLVGVPVVAAVVALARRSWEPLVDAVVPVGLLVLGVEAVKVAVDRAGPPGSAGGGDYYPSGHTSTALVSTLVLVRLARGGPRARLAAGAWATAVAVCLLVAHDHWLSDLVGGALFAGLVAVVTGLLPGRG